MISGLLKFAAFAAPVCSLVFLSACMHVPPRGLAGQKQFPDISLNELYFHMLDNAHWDKSTSVFRPLEFKKNAHDPRLFDLSENGSGLGYGDNWKRSMRDLDAQLLSL